MDKPTEPVEAAGLPIKVRFADGHEEPLDAILDELERARVAPPDPPTAMREIAAERERQIVGEGWTVAHDDAHDTGQMARAAACYALHAGSRYSWSADEYRRAEPETGDPELQDTLWPWDRKWWKPKDPRRDLVRAAALIVAEIERIDRALVASSAPPKP